MQSELLLFHGSPNVLVGDTLNPSQGEDSDERPENNQFGVYATDKKELAIVMAILGCPDVIGGSIDEYKNDAVNATIHGEFPKQKYVYIYSVPAQTFTQTKIDPHQFVSFVGVKPVAVEKLRVGNHTHLLKKATSAQTKKWLAKYG